MYIHTYIQKEKMIQAYKDWCKNEHFVGSGMVILAGKELAAQIKLKLDSRCSNNQAEQIAIPKVLQSIDSLIIPEDSSRTARIYTGSRITLDSLKKANNHVHLIEEIRKRVSALESSKWMIEF